MIEVTDILVASYDLDHLDIFWKLNSQASESIEEYDFYVLRSVDGFAGPYGVIAGPFYNTFVFRDSNVHRLHKWRNYYYKIRLVHRATQKTREYGPQWLQAPPDRIACEIRRRESLLFKEFAGRLVFLFPQLTFGQRCKTCWDQGARGNTLGRSVQQNCAVCFDTTFVGGFAKPMAVYVQIDPAPIESQRTDQKEHQFVKTTARTNMFPPIHTKDMIVERENRRWLVEKVSFTEIKRAVVRQELVLFEYPKDDIKFSVPINADLKMLHSTERSMSRPMSVQIRPVTPEKDLLKQ